MKRAVGIIAVVAVYTLVETLLLLRFIEPIQIWLPDIDYQRVILASQLLLVPGFAVLFSFLAFGHHGWIRRTLRIIVIGTFGVPLFLAPPVLAGWLLD